MTELTLEQKKLVLKEVEVHLASLPLLKSSIAGGPSGPVISPHRAITKTKNDT